MNTDGLTATEVECAAGRTAPRVSLDDIKANIAGEFFNTADQMFPGAPVLPGMDLLTICILVLQNGFTIIGKSAPASRDNFDPVLGQKLAYEDAVRQVWPLMGYALRDRLHAATMPEVGDLDPTEQPTD
ncbi:Gp49 family protein [Sphingomonas sp. RP10(2022)]|uniref:Gp49 family protein n=1 Tax=Sphingomonas liriopis TaxID=2949094 RepID=A0A9X2HSB5_9SPHN|nr:Gp49 family protein [Sphingomonas liriopis]MCP3735632.1 Gp49 family protein [Sphingomonas liriopis]